MSASDVPTWVLTGAVVFTTFLVYRATKKVAEATKETTKITIMPRLVIAVHNKLEGDKDHDHYGFHLKNEGLGTAFDIRIESMHETGSTVFPIVKTLGINAATLITDKSVDKDAIAIKFKIKFQDLAENQYKKEFLYNFQDGSITSS